MSLPEIVAALLVTVGSALIILNLWLADEPPPADSNVSVGRFRATTDDHQEWRRAA